MREHRRYALWLLVWIVLAGALMSAVKLEADRQERVRMASFRNDVTDLAHIAETAIADKLRSYDNSLLVLRRAYVDDPSHLSDTIRLLRSGPLADSEILVVLVDREGLLTYTDTPNVKRGLYLGDRAYFRFFADGGADRLYIDEPTFGRVTKRFTLPLVRPIYNRQGRFMGVIALSVKQEPLGHFGANLQLSSNTTVTVVNYNGAVVTSSRDFEKVRGTKLLPEMLTPMIAGEEGIFSNNSSIDGIKRIIAYRHINVLDVPLILFVSSLPDDVLRITSRQRNVLLSGAGLISLIILFLIVVNLQRQKISDKLIATQQAHLQQAQRIARMGSWELDLETQKFQWSDEVYNLFGVTREAFNPNLENFLSLIPETSHSAVRKAIEEAVVKEHISVEHSVLRGDGQLREMVERIEAVRNAKGKVSLLIGTVQDITERKRAEEALWQSEKKFRALFEQAGDYILLLKVSEDKGLVIVDANQAACEIHGYSHEEILGASIKDIDRDLDEENMRAILERVLSGESFLFETTHVKKDGTTMPVEVSAKLLDPEGERSLIISIERDITERRQAEEKLKKYYEQLEELVKNRTEELEEKTKDLEEFNKLFVDREFRIKKLRDKVKELEGI